MGKKKRRKKKIDRTMYEGRGRDYFSKGDFRQAINEWKPLLRSESADSQLIDDLAWAYYQQGISLYKENKLESAKANLSNAVKLKPEEAAYLFHLGLCLHKAGQLKEGISTYRQTLRLEPDNKQARCCLSLALLRTGQTREVITILESLRNLPALIVTYLKEGKIDDCYQLLKSLGRDEESLFAGLLSLKKGEVDKALPLLENASKMPIFRKIVAYYLGVAYIRKDRLKEAVQTLEVACQEVLLSKRAAKNLKILYQRLGVKLIKEGKNDEAIKIWEKLLEIDDQNREVKHNLCHAYYLKGNAAIKEDDTKEAINCWLKAEAIDNTRPDILHNLALAYDRIEEYQQANKYWIRVISGWRKALCSSDDKERLRGYLNVAYRHLGDNYLTEDEVEKAISAYNSALSYDDEDIRTRSELGELYLYEGRIDSAIKEFKKILRHKPNDVEALNNLGQSYNLDDQPEEAIRYWQRAIELEPDTPLIKERLSGAYAHQSSLLTKQGKFEEALWLIDRAGELTGETCDTYLVRGLIYMEANDLSKAESCYKQSIKLDKKNHTIYLRIGLRYLDCHLLDKAAEYFKKAVRYGRKDPFIYDAIGMAYCEKKLCEQAHHHFDLAIKKAPPFLQMSRKIGEMAWEKMNCRQWAKKYLEIAAKMIPDDSDIHFKIGMLYMYDLNTEKAEENFQIAERLAKDEGNKELVSYINMARSRYKHLMSQGKAMRDSSMFMF